MTMQKYIADIYLFLYSINLTDARVAQKSGKIYVTGNYNDETVNLVFANFNVKSNKPEIVQAWIKYLSALPFDKQLACDYHKYCTNKTRAFVKEVNDLIEDVKQTLDK